jgi:hypothetical protein
MRNLLAFLAAAAIAFAGAGYYLGWYQVESSASASGHRQVNIDLDSAKMSADLRKESSRVGQVIDTELPAATNGSN